MLTAYRETKTPKLQTLKKYRNMYIFYSGSGEGRGGGAVYLLLNDYKIIAKTVLIFIMGTKYNYLLSFKFQVEAD